jgi:dephospho-CoA kinase
VVDGPGVIAVTGQIGAGKSIIIGGLQRYGCHYINFNLNLTRYENRNHA